MFFVEEKKKYCKNQKHPINIVFKKKKKEAYWNISTAQAQKCTYYDAKLYYTTLNILPMKEIYK